MSVPMTPNVDLISLGLVFLEVGFVLVAALAIAFALKRLEIPAVLGLIIGGLTINFLLGTAGAGVEHLFTDFDVLKKIITELALAWIGYSIGNELDLRVLRTNGRRFSFVLLGEALGAFLFISVGLWLVTGNLRVALLLGSIGMATAPAATSQVLTEYKAEGDLTQTLLFIIAFDDTLAILFVNMALGFASQSGVTGIPLLVSILFHLAEDVIFSTLLGLLGTVIIIILMRSNILTQGTLLEWLLGTAFVLVGVAELLGTSVILTMFVWGALLKTLETQPSWCPGGTELLEKHVLSLEVLMVPIVMLFFVLIGLLMDIALLLSVGTLGVSVIYFTLRAVGKGSGSWITCRVSSFQDKVAKNLPLCLLTQAGVAIGLAGLAFDQLLENGHVSDAYLVLNVIGVSVILAEIIGPYFVKKAIFRAGENQAGRDNNNSNGGGKDDIPEVGEVSG